MSASVFSLRLQDGRATALQNAVARREAVKCLCTNLQEIDNLIHNNLADIVVELLMTLYEGSGAHGDGGDLGLFTG